MPCSALLASLVTVCAESLFNAGSASITSDVWCALRIVAVPRSPGSYRALVHPTRDTGNDGIRCRLVVNLCRLSGLIRCCKYLLCLAQKWQMQNGGIVDHCTRIAVGRK